MTFLETLHIDLPDPRHTPSSAETNAEIVATLSTLPSLRHLTLDVHSTEIESLGDFIAQSRLLSLSLEWNGIFDVLEEGDLDWVKAGAVAKGIRCSAVDQCPGRLTLEPHVFVFSLWSGAPSPLALPIRIPNVRRGGSFGAARFFSSIHSTLGR